MDKMKTIESRETSLSNQELATIAQETLKNIEKVRWDNEKIEAELGRRSIQEIIDSKETFYMGACVDMTLAFLIQLKDKIPEDKLQVGCELLRQNESGNLTFHFFLKDLSTHPTRIIDFVKRNEVLIYEGEYENPTEGTKVSQINNFHLSAQNISKEDSFLSIAKKMGINLSPELFQAYINKIQHDNTPEKFEQFIKTAPIQVKFQEAYKDAQLKIFKVLETPEKKKKAD